MLYIQNVQISILTKIDYEHASPAKHGELTKAVVDFSSVSPYRPFMKPALRMTWKWWEMVSHSDNSLYLKLLITNTFKKITNTAISKI